MANTAFKEFLKEAERNKEYIKRIKDLLEEGQFGLLPLQQIFTIREGIVVINRKTTKFESNSQQHQVLQNFRVRCYQSQNYKI